MKTVRYKCDTLATTSDAYKLFEAKEYKLLDAHLRRLTLEAEARGEIQRKEQTQ